MLEDGLAHLEAKACDFLLEAVANDYEARYGMPWLDELFDTVVREIQVLNLVEASASEILDLADVIFQQILPPSGS